MVLVRGLCGNRTVRAKIFSGGRKFVKRYRFCQRMTDILSDVKSVSRFVFQRFWTEISEKTVTPGNGFYN